MQSFIAAQCKRYCKINNILVLVLLLLLLKVWNQVEVETGDSPGREAYWQSREREPPPPLQPLDPDIGPYLSKKPAKEDGPHGDASFRKQSRDLPNTKLPTQRMVPQRSSQSRGFHGTVTNKASGVAVQKPDANLPKSGSHFQSKNGVADRRLAVSKKPVQLPFLRRVNMTSNSSSKSSVKTGAGKKYLIYLCDTHQMCGGWGDRVRGIVAVFLLAQVTNRTFGIHMTTPCPLTWFYRPNEVDWRVPSEVFSRRDKRVIDAVDNTTVRAELSNVSFDALYPESAVFLRNNLDFFFTLRASKIYNRKFPPWAFRKSRHDAFKSGWRILMKPSLWLQQKYDAMMTKPSGGKYTTICAHVRIGINPSNPFDVVYRNTLADTDTLWPFLKQHAQRVDKVFLATDSQAVRKKAQEIFGGKEIDSGGEIVHIDRVRQDACGGFGVALLDHLVLSRCQILVISKSMFSASAAFIRGSMKDLYRFDRGNLTAYNLNM